VWYGKNSVPHKVELPLNGFGPDLFELPVRLLMESAKPMNMHCFPDAQGHLEPFRARLHRAFRLIPAYARMGKIELARAHTFAEMLLDLHSEVSEEPGGYSGLNGDGSPLQLCVSLSLENAKCRLIADPASDDSGPRTRYDRARTVLRTALLATNTLSLQDPINELLAALGPQNEAHTDDFTHGVFWLGAAAEQSGIAIYVDMSVYPVADAWERTLSWLASHLKTFKASVRAIDALHRIQPYCRLSSAGIEGYDREHFRYKLYIRGIQHLPEGIMGSILPSLSELEKCGCFHILMGNAGLSSEGILYNIGIDSITNEIFDFKIDLSGSILSTNTDTPGSIIDRCSNALGVHVANLDSLIEGYGLKVSFVGIGIDICSHRRVNVYLKGAT
jgi:hypothetical protein